MRRRRGLALAVALSLASTSASAAAPPADEAGEGADLEASAKPDAGGGAGEDAESPESPEPAEGEGVTPPPTPEQPATSAGMGNSVISSQNPEARRARADLEGTSLLETSAEVPDRLPPLQRAAWWTMFGSFALASAGGVFAGLAEVQEDRASRLASTIDLESGGAFNYADKADEYEAILAKGERQAWAARGLLIGAGVALVAGISLFAVHGARQRRSSARARIRPSGGGLEVRF